MGGSSGVWRFSQDGGYVERECLLFEAGDYPDRGVDVTEDDLRQIAANTDSDVPVRVEHLSQSPFDGALGVVTGIHAVGRRLFGTLRQPVEAWRFVQRAGAKSLSIALDIASKKIAEVSFVCSPRVASAQVFSSIEPAATAQPDGRALFVSPSLFAEPGRTEEKEMGSVRQFAEGLMQYIRGVVGSEAAESGQFSQTAGQEQEQLRLEREALALERAEREIEDLKRRGLLRATEQVEALASTLLRFGVTNVVRFGSEQVRLDKLVVQLLEANGPVIPMGEWAAAAADTGGASDRLIAMARDTSKRDGIPYLAAFSRVSSAHPDLARAAREESING
jgi:hypothetical protein